VTTTETVTWIAVAQAMPDAEESVIMAWHPDSFAYPDPEKGWWDGEAWCLAESGGEVIEPPLWWAKWVVGPSGAEAET